MAVIMHHARLIQALRSAVTTFQVIAVIDGSAQTFLACGATSATVCSASSGSKPNPRYKPCAERASAMVGVNDFGSKFSEPRVQHAFTMSPAALIQTMSQPGACQ